jgi:hypothetical protein
MKMQNCAQHTMSSTKAIFLDVYLLAGLTLLNASMQLCKYAFLRLIYSYFGNASVRRALLSEASSFLLVTWVWSI